MRSRSLQVALIATLVATTAGAQSTIDRAGWLAGCWEARGANRVVVEMWMPPMGDLMVGGSRTVVGAATREFEHLRIRARGDTLVYTALPSGQAETDFRATHASADSLVFENLAHDFPQRIAYRRMGADSVVARVEGPGPNNTTRGFNVAMRRVDCARRAPGPTIPPPDTVVIDAEVSPDGRTLLIVKGVGSAWDIYASDLRPPNSALRRLTDQAAVDYQPAWSADGRRLAFVSVRDGHQEIYTMRPDGSELTQLTRGTAHNSEPSWSPNGRTLAFRSERDGLPRVYLMNADGTEQRQLITGDTAASSAPDWSRDGRQVILASARSGRTEIYSVNADGTALTQLTQTAQGHSGVPIISPDGRHIAFWSTRDGNDEVYLMRADGSEVRNLSNHPSRESPLGFSGDGARVLFRSLRDRPLGEVYSIKLDGTGLERLTTTANLPPTSPPP